MKFLKIGLISVFLIFISNFAHSGFLELDQDDLREEKNISNEECLKVFQEGNILRTDVIDDGYGNEIDTQYMIVFGGYLYFTTFNLEEEGHLECVGAVGLKYD